MNNRPEPRVARTALVRGLVVPVGALAVTATATLLTAVPAFADDGLGEKRPSGLSALDTALIFVGIPALVISIVFALVYGLSRNNEPRLREGQAWWSEPEYYSKDSASTDDASAGAAAEQSRTTDGGGTGARW